MGHVSICFKVPCRCKLRAKTYVGSVAGVGLLESAGDGDGRAGVGVTAASHGDLSAGDVELGDTRGPGVVDTQGLDAKKILAVGDASGEVESVGPFLLAFC